MSRPFPGHEQRSQHSQIIIQNYPTLLFSTVSKEASQPTHAITVYSWGGGDGQTYEFALKNPTKTAAFIALDTAIEGVEFRLHQQIEGLDDAETEEYFNQQIAGRLSFTNMINGLAVPWGLMPLFITRTLVNAALFKVPFVKYSCNVSGRLIAPSGLSGTWTSRRKYFIEEGSEARFIELSLQVVLPNREDMGHSDRVHQRYEIVSTLISFRELSESIENELTFSAIS